MGDYMNYKYLKNTSLVLAIIGFISVLFGTSYAWFNFRQEGGSNRLIAGDIYLKLDDAENNLILTNIFPETASEARKRENNVLTFGVYGKNTTNKTIYYEIKLNYGTSQDSPMKRFADSDLRFDLVEVTEVNNQEVETYLLSNVGYDTINNQRIWVDTIDAEEDEVIEKTYRLRAWIAEDVIISDSYSGADYTASDYKNHYASVKVSVYGDMQEKSLSGLYQIVKNDVAKGYALEYMGESKDTVNNPSVQKVYYYKGTVKDTDSTSATYNETMNNVIFGGFCWQMVRTTDTGGVKMIYNGRPVNNQCMSSRENQTGVYMTGTVASVKLSDTYYYYGTNYEIDYTNSVFKLSGNLTYEKWSSSTGPNLLNKYTCKSIDADGTCGTLYYVVSVVNNTNGGTLSHTFSSSSFNTIGKNSFNVVGMNAPAYVGYMYNTVYDRKIKQASGVTGIKFANSYKYINGQYYLDDDYETKTVTDWSTEYTTMYNTHYTCLTAGNDCGTSINYVYGGNSDNMYYITINGNKSVDNVLAEMLNSNDVNAKESTMKTYIDNWYRNNLTAFAGYIEDTIYCNDRNILRTGSYGITNSGWNPNGGAFNNSLSFAGRETNRTNLKCTSTVDSFSVSNSSAHLTYPVGLLTWDEINLALTSSNVGAFYLKRVGIDYWLLTPVNFWSNASGYGSYLATVKSGNITGGIAYQTYGVRPVITLKATNEFLEGGTGAESNPYVVKTININNNNNS